MTKFVFRSLAREHPEPSELLARSPTRSSLDEVERGQVRDHALPDRRPCDRRARLRRRRSSRAAVVRPDGTVEELEARGLALGIDADQQYAEATDDARAGRVASCSSRTGSSRPERRRALREGAARPPAGRAARTCRRSELARARRGGCPGIRRRRARGRLRRVVVKRTTSLRLSFQATLDVRRLRRRGRDAGDGDRCVATARAVLRELDDRLGERHRAHARVALGRLLARRPARRPAPDAHGARAARRRRRGLSRRGRRRSSPARSWTSRSRGSTGSRPAPRSARSSACSSCSCRP